MSVRGSWRAACVASMFGFGTAASAQVPVKIGVLADMTGIYSDIGGEGITVAATMAVEDYLAKAPNSIKAEIVSADGQKPDIGAGIARRWFDQEGVDVLVDIPTSAVSLAVAPIAREKNKVALMTASGTSDLTGKGCTPNSVHWTYDTYALARGTATEVTKAGGKTWFFITADYAFGHAMERDATKFVSESGGKVLGSVRHPVGTTDYSAYLLQAQASKAEVVAFLNAGGDTITAIKQSSEFGIVQGGQKLAGLLLFISDTHSLTLPVAQGLRLTTAFYWDLNEKTRDFGERFAKRNRGRYPSMTQAGAYSATLAYLGAVNKLGSAKDGAALVKAMRDAGTFDDPLFGKTSIRIDGRTIHDMYLVEVKKPAESKKPYDFYKVVSTIPAAEAFRSLSESECPLAK